MVKKITLKAIEREATSILTIAKVIYKNTSNDQLLTPEELQ